MAENVIAELMISLGVTPDYKQIEDALKETEKRIEQFEKDRAVNNETENEIDKADAATEKAAGQKSSAQSYNKAASGLNKASDEGIKLLKGTMGTIEKIYQKLVASSPLLQSVEQLFNLAMTLFFMPLGNALAEEMIPAILDLVDNVIAMWDSFEGKSLEEIFTGTIEYGVEIFSKYFATLGESLSEHGGLLGSIGNALKSVASLITKMPDLMSMGIELMSVIIGNIDKIIAAIVAFKVASVMMQTAQIAATAGSGTIAGLLGIGSIPIAIGAGAMAVNLLNGSVDTSKVKATSTGGNTYNNTYNISGLTSTEELTKAIQSANTGEVTDKNSQS